MKLQDVKHGQTVKVKGYGIGKVATIGNTGCQVKMPSGEYLSVLFRDLLLVSEPESQMVKGYPVIVPGGEPKKDVELCSSCLHRDGNGVCEFTTMVEHQMNFCDAYDRVTKAPAKDRIGTSYIGQFKGTYARLVELFGEPLPGSSDGKTDAEWCLFIKRPGGEYIVTIYNWKNGPRFYGGTLLSEVKTWNVGSKNVDKVEAMDLVNLLRYMANESQIGK